MTRREEIEKLLSEKAHSVQDLANYFRVTAKEIQEDLSHVAFSIKPRKLKLDPAYCKSCGFVFKERSKISRPSKCPKCRKEWIEEARFSIK
ncbi:transcriptional regulator [Candidatus Woesearchaeota archaeon]|nr:transcriptional regulator [Candidatus Woesearchaeota archaeon]